MKMTRTQQAFVKDMAEHYLRNAVAELGLNADELVSEELIDYVATECGPVLFDHITFAELKRVDAFLQSDEYARATQAQEAFLQKVFEVMHADKAPQMLSAVMTEMLNPMDNPELFAQVLITQEQKEIAEFESQGLEAQINMAVARAKALEIEPAQEQEINTDTPFVAALKDPSTNVHALAKESLEQVAKL